MLNNKLAFITGGGRGIGAAIAREFASAGADIVVAARTEKEVNEVAAEVAANHGVTARAVVCDVSNPQDVAEKISSTVENFGRAVDILVNNAGIAQSMLLHKTSNEMWQRIMDINLNGTFYCTKEVLPAMLAQGWGRIINISSIAGKSGTSYLGAYTASKHGVVGLTRSLSIEVAPHGITVNAICPGYVETEMAWGAIRNITAKTGQSADEARAYLEKMNPQNRMVTSEEVAALALLLASDAGRGINGQAINIDGGVIQS